LYNISGANLPETASLNSNLLTDLLAIDSPSGDESVMTDYLIDWILTNSNIELEVDPDAAGDQVVRLRNSLVVVKGDQPLVGIIAHIDTTGFTVGHDGILIPIGSPDAAPADLVRVIGDPNGSAGLLVDAGDGRWSVSDLEVSPGDRLVYAAKPIEDAGFIRSPYLDNRAGIWAALQALQACDRIAVAFTTGEETSTSGAITCARYLYDKLDITRAIIADITWDTEHVHCGAGVAISRRDRYVPSQDYVDQMIGMAAESGIPYQIEIESDGGSDGAGIERSGCPIDWAFIGAPEKRPHSATEEVCLADLDAMAKMLGHLVDRVTGV
jgi:putative aminopeptidase FrvX